MIKNLIFDFGKVLVDYDYDLFFRQFIDEPDRRMRFSALINTPEMQDIYDRELEPLSIIMDGIIRENPEFEAEVRYFHDHYPDVVLGEMAGMKELLVKLKGEGYKLYGLTNWCSKVYLTMKQYEIFNLLDGYVISSEEHVIKPYPEIYTRLLDKYGLKASESLFTDDRPINIEGARQVGIAGIVFHDALQYERDLRQIR